MSKRIGLRIVLCLGLGLGLVLMAVLVLQPLPVSADTYQVTNTNAHGAYSLRWAIVMANQNLGYDIIDFDPEVSGTIVLTEPLVIDGDLTIIGNGSTLITVSGDSLYRVFSITQGSAVTITGLTIAYGTAGQGGGIYHAGDALKLDDVVVRNNAVTNEGGGIYVAGPLTLTNSAVRDNTAWFAGGGLYIATGTVTLQSGQIYSNAVTVSGDNRAGGGVYVDQAMAAFIQTGGAVERNRVDSALGDGGGIYVNAGRAELRGGAISSNTVNDYGGGVFVNQAGARFIQTGGSVEGNQADYDNCGGTSGGQTIHCNGGGVFVNEGRAELSGGSIRNNTAGKDGGGVYVFQPGASFGQTGGSIEHNAAKNTATFDGGGGGVYVYSGTLTVSAGQIYSNTARHGGGVYAAGGQFDLSGSGQVAANRADNTGGGVEIDDAAVFNQTGGAVAENTAVNGGGLWLNGPAHLTGGQIVSNTASNNGGGIYSSNTLELAGADILSNTARYEGGGGVYVRDGVVTQTAGAIRGNRAKGSSCDGAGVYLYANARMVLQDGEISHNTADRNGGGVFVGSDGRFVQQGGLIAYNAAGSTGNGGGVHALGDYELQAGQVFSNTALSGGGVSASGAFTQTGGALAQNSASSKGGGLYVSSPNIALLGGEIVSNTADWGGGVCMYASRVDLNAGTIAGNRANYGGGVYVYNTNSRLALAGGAVERNTAVERGGGVYLSSGSAVMSDGRIGDNEALGISTYGSGGGVLISSGVFTQTGGLIESNAAEPVVGGGDGGGVCVYGGRAALLGGEIRNNRADYGGGLYVSTNADVGNVALVNNTATTKGDAITTRGTFNQTGVVTATGSVRQSGGAFNGSSHTFGLGGLLIEGGTFSAPGLLVFGGVTANLTLNQPTTFNHLTIVTSTLLVETNAADNATVNGTLTNYGTIRKTQTIGETGAKTFGLTGVAITVTTQGTLSNLQVDRIDSDHPNATGTSGGHGIHTGRYWRIMPTGANYTVTLTLPHNNLADPQVCKYPGGLGGAGWDCARDSFTTAVVVRSGVTGFSDWAVGESVGPTAVTLRSLCAQGGADLIGWLSLAGLILSGAGWRRRRPRVR